MKKIVVAGANPARQKTLIFEHFIKGEVNRAVSMDEFASGKGVNFCRAAGVFGSAKAVLIQFSGGGNGEFIDECLRREKIEFHSVKTAAPTRCCITSLEKSSGIMTESIEPSFAAEADEIGKFLGLFENELASAAAAAICGTLPGNTDPDVYMKLGKKAAQYGVPILLDAYKNVEDLLALGNVILKINREELEKLSGIDGVENGLRAVFARYPLKYVAITDGAGRAFASDGCTMMCYDLPALPEIVNPIGCGDTASAVWMSGIAAGKPVFEAFRSALGAASANAETLMPGSFRLARAAELAEKTVMTQGRL